MLRLCRLQHVKATGKSYVSPVPMSLPGDSLMEEDEPLLSVNPSLMCLRNGALQKGLAERLQDVQRRRQFLDRQRNTWWVRRTLFYPLAMLALFALSTATALLAVQNTLELLIGIKALPLSTRVRMCTLFPPQFCEFYNFTSQTNSLLRFSIRLR